MEISKIITITRKRYPLYYEIEMLKNPSKETVKKLYGDFGVDIFEGKKEPTILSEREKKRNLIDKIITWFTGYAPQDYQDGDSLYTVVLKYIGNKKVGLSKDIENKFGLMGLEQLESLRLSGYVKP